MPLRWLILLAVTPLIGSSTHAPLPANVREAKTLIILNRSEQQAVRDDVAAAIKNNKVLSIVTNEATSDLLLLLENEGDRITLSFFITGSKVPFLVQTVEKKAIRHCLDEFSTRLAEKN